MILIFNDGTWPIMSNRWTVGFPPDSLHETRVVYGWGVANSQAGYLVSVPVGETEFTTFLANHVDSNGICDIRPLQKKP